MHAPKQRGKRGFKQENQRKKKIKEKKGLYRLYLWVKMLWA